MPDSCKISLRPRRWAPRIWMGCNFSGWRAILRKHGHAFDWPYVHIVAADTIGSLCNTVLGRVQDLLYGATIERTQLTSPIFIIGHWRGGTTLLHELLSLDPRLQCPTNYQCFSPNHFLLTGWIFPHILSFFIPTRRPMDNMELSWRSPQEDEFALCNLGVPSPYWKIAFPREPMAWPEYQDLTQLSTVERDAWCATWMRFLKQVAYQSGGRRLVIKSPLHSFRIALIRELFPEARFIHMVRDPVKVFFSTVHLWKCLYAAQGLQRPDWIGLENDVLETGRRMYEAIDSARAGVAEDRWCDVRFEDLTRCPIETLEAIYARLDLGDIGLFRDALMSHWNARSDYTPNRFEIDEALRARVLDEWLPHFARYGYADASRPSRAGAREEEVAAASVTP